MDIALKQRLVGAIVLIALAVIVLPMLLGGRPDDGGPQPRQIELPPQPAELDFETRRFPIGEGPRPATKEQTPPPARELPTPVQSPAPPPSLETQLASEPTAGIEPDTESQTQPEPETPPAPSIPETDTPPQTESATAPSLPVETEPGSGRYIVQVASFGATENANRLTEALRGYGYEVMTDTIKSDIGTLHRVRVGPFDRESEATETVARLKTQVDGIKPRIMDLQPDEAAEVTEPEDPLVRWVVQVGSFASAANADNLVQRLRDQSLTAYREERSRSGSVIYRVRVGPFLKREDALDANRLVRERLSLEGVVMSAD